MYVKKNHRYVKYVNLLQSVSAPAQRYVGLTTNLQDRSFTRRSK